MISDNNKQEHAKGKKFWISVLAIAGGAVLVFGAWFSKRMLDDFIAVPPDGLTRTTMLVLQTRIYLYIHKNGKIPQGLDQLPELNGYYNSIRDGWGHPILYFVATNGVITLTSFGADGKPGGIGQSADIIESFPTKDSSGKWIE